MKKQIFNNIVSEKTLKEAYGHNSELRDSELAEFTRLKELRTELVTMKKNGFDTTTHLKTILSKIGVKQLNRLTPENRDVVSFYMFEKYHDSEFFVAE